LKEYWKDVTHARIYTLVVFVPSRFAVLSIPATINIKFILVPANFVVHNIEDL
jgi:hypothetical protein